MRIDNLKINAYGNIKNKDISLNKGINIIHGANESGKSTLLSYIVNSFYGISKTKDGREMSDYEKYKPWEGSEFSGRIKYTLMIIHSMKYLEILLKRILKYIMKD